MKKAFFSFFLFVLLSSTAFADDAKDCGQGVRDPKVAIPACTKIIASKKYSAEVRATAYALRAVAYATKGDDKAAFKDNAKAIELSPTFYVPYLGRCALYNLKGDFEKALLDCAEAIRLAPSKCHGYFGRSAIYYSMGQYDSALRDAKRAVSLAKTDADLADSLTHRGAALSQMGDSKAALSDLDRALSLRSNDARAYYERGLVRFRFSETEAALADFSRAVQFARRPFPQFLADRAQAYAKLGYVDKALADARRALSIPAFVKREQDGQIRAAELLTKLTAPQTIAAPAPAPSEQPKGQASGRRIALVIGNTHYAAVGALKNPVNDARAVAATLKHIGFTVSEGYDVPLGDMTRILRDFGDAAASADWAVIYYAGHGLEMNGVAYLIPVDARLAKDIHVQDEAISLDRMLEKVQGARAMRLIILDACRNNPFVARMARTAAVRSFGRGLPAIEPEGDVLVAYATRHGTTASDGEGENGPYALALAHHIPDPGIDIRVVFGRVRDEVRKLTANQQEPFTYGSIGGELRFFMPN